MSKAVLTVPQELDAARVDKVVRALWPAISRAQVKRAMDAGEVRLNGKRVPKGATAHAGDTVEIDDALVRAADEACAPEPGAPLTVAFESADVVVVNKPAGTPTAPLSGTETGTLANALVARFPELSGIGYSGREPGLVHRLDTDTSGLVVVARNARAFEELRDALHDGVLEKEYLLVCAGADLPDDGEIAYPLANHPKDRRRVLACTDARDVMRLAPRAATTRFRVERRAGERALVRAWAPKALRHQIRAHFAAIDHPLVGDALYGGETTSSIARHALHAARVAYAGSGALRFDVSAELPSDMAALLDAPRTA